MSRHFQLIAVSVIAIAASAIVGADSAPATRPAPLPPPVAAVREKIQGKKPQEVLAIMSADFGKPSRDVGSGLSIPQWDVAGGVLTYHEWVGPTFRAGGRTVWLIRTHNSVGDTLTGSFEMTTPPDPANHGNRFWLGNLDLHPDGTYSMKTGGSGERQDVANASFFGKHPRGTYAVTYAEKVDKASLLEDVADGTDVVTLKFTPDQAAGAEAVYKVRAAVDERQMEIVPAEGKATFQLEKGWKNHWE